jgi:hypothetical protein
MKTGFTAIPTTYAGVDFRSRLEARWAAFFDLAEWKWEYEPINLRGWIPDFRVDPAYWGDYGTYFLLVEVKPYRSIDEFKGTVEYGLAMDPVFESSDRAALFGHTPAVSYWEAWSSGRMSIPEYISDWEQKWSEAQRVVQWRGPQRGLGVMTRNVER